MASDDLQDSSYSMLQPATTRRLPLWIQRAHDNARHRSPLQSTAPELQTDDDHEADEDVADEDVADEDVADEDIADDYVADEDVADEVSTTHTCSEEERTDGSSTESVATTDEAGPDGAAESYPLDLAVDSERPSPATVDRRPREGQQQAISPPATVYVPTPLRLGQQVLLRMWGKVKHVERLYLLQLHSMRLALLCHVRSVCKWP